MKPIKTQARAATILPSFVGLKFHVHNGKVYNEVEITEDMVGHKLGEFSLYVVPSFISFSSSSPTPVAVDEAGWSRNVPSPSKHYLTSLP